MWIVLASSAEGWDIDPWNLGASQLCDALGIPPHLQEEIRLEGIRHVSEGKIIYPQAA